MGFDYQRLIERLAERDAEEQSLASALRLRRLALRWYGATGSLRAAWCIGDAELEFAVPGVEAPPDADPQRWLRLAITARSEFDTWWWAWLDLARLARSLGDARRAAARTRPLTSRCSHPSALLAWDLRFACLLEAGRDAEAADVADRLLGELLAGRVEAMGLVDCVPLVEAAAQRDARWEPRRQALWRAIGW
ncbi:MAG: hypothetical protein R3E87_27235 [Burkholderiaceae bacterium]